MIVDDVVDIAAAAAAVESVADLARVLRALRRREARRRSGPELTSRQIANRTGWSLSVVGEYLTGVRLASVERFDELVRLLGASAVEQGLLASARERAGASRGAAAETSTDGVPRMLPAPVGGFIGRDAQLAELNRLLAGRVGTLVISALAGMGGVGKTALAVHWAHRVADMFPDGQLYVNLRGYDPAAPLTVSQALGVLLAGMGVPSTTLPVDVRERAALYHRILRRRRILVVLDNAGGVEQVRPLLPPPSCLAVVTSRDDLEQLITVESARRLTLDVLPEDEAVTLLRLLVGQRADREPGAVHALARLCGRLPLALRVAAEHASFRPCVPLRELVGELGGLEAFPTSDDERTDVRAVFNWSLRRLSAPAARAFRLLGLVPGGDVDVYGLAALAGVDPTTAGRLAETLAGAHLVQPDGRGRFSMHDLVRAYAMSSAERDLAHDERHDAATRLLDYYLTTATAAADIQYPFATPARPRQRPTPMWDGAIPDVHFVRSAASWMAAERDNLVRACVHAARHGWPGHAVALAAVLLPALDDGHYIEGLAVHTEAQRAAEIMGNDCDPVDRAFIRICFAVTNWRLGRIDVAAADAARALDDNTRLDCAEGVAMSLIVLGLIRDCQGRLREAIDCQLRSLDIARTAGNRTQEAVQLLNLGSIHLRLEEYDAAARFHRQALVAFDAIGQATGAAEARHGLAAAYAWLGRHDEALALAEQALAVEIEYGHLLTQAEIMVTIGRVYQRQGRHGDAVEQLAQALAVCRDVDQPALTAHALNTLGDTYRDDGDHASSVECHGEALQLAEHSGDWLGRARALVGLGDAYAASGDTEQAQSRWRQALDAYTEMRLPAAEAVRARLSASAES
jgi:tetratricopeptide (TPR) repeat protein